MYLVLFSTPNQLDLWIEQLKAAEVPMVHSDYQLDSKKEKIELKVVTSWNKDKDKEKEKEKEKK